MPHTYKEGDIITLDNTGVLYHYVNKNGIKTLVALDHAELANYYFDEFKKIWDKPHITQAAIEQIIGHKHEDNSRLCDSMSLYAVVYTQHESHSFFYRFLHPINFFTEWNVMRKMKNIVLEKGFTKTEFNTAKTTCINQIISSGPNPIKEENDLERSFDSCAQKDLARNIQNDTQVVPLLITNPVCIQLNPNSKNIDDIDNNIINNVQQSKIYMSKLTHKN